MEGALFLFVKSIPQMYKSGKVMASCNLDFNYKILGLYNLIKTKYDKTIVGIVFKVSKQ